MIIIVAIRNYRIIILSVFIINLLKKMDMKISSFYGDMNDRELERLIPFLL